MRYNLCHIFQKFLTTYRGKKSGFFSEMTLTHFQKSDFWNFDWIFSKNDAYLFAGFWIFSEDSRIWIKYNNE